MSSIWVPGEGDHEGRPYANLVGASDPSPVGAGLGLRNSMFALHLQPSRLVSPDIRTRVLL
jgi:hypothetical protein